MRQIDRHVLLSTPATDKRPAATIVAKDTSPYVEYCAELPSGDVLVVEQSGYAEPQGNLFRRQAGTFTKLAELPGVNADGALSADGKRLLASGPMLSGNAASCVVIDLESWTIEHTLPLIRPFVWIDAQRFVAQTPSFRTSFATGKLVISDTRQVDPALAASAPWLLADAPGLVLVDLVERTARPLLASKPLDEERYAVLSPAGDVLYSATDFSRISAVRVADGSLLWQRPAVRLVTDGSTHAIAYDATTSRLLTVGIGDIDFLALDPHTGAELARDNVSTRLRRVGFHEASGQHAIALRADGLVVMANQGIVIESWPDGRWTACKAASRAIHSLAFLADGTQLLIGGAEKNLRVLSYADGA